MPHAPFGGMVGTPDAAILDLPLSASLARDLAAADYLRVLATFAEDLDRLLSALETALARRDADAVRVAAHGIAGAAATVGAVVVERTARAIIEAGVGAGAPLLATLRADGTRALRALAALIGAADAGPHGGTSPGA